MDEPGEYGINRLVEGAQRTQKDSLFEMIWRSPQDANILVKVNFRLVSGNTGGGIGANPSYKGLLLSNQVVMNKVARIVAAQAVSLNQLKPETSALAGQQQLNTGVLP